MGQHTKNMGDASSPDDIARRGGWVGKVPLLPAVAGVVAVGAIVSAVSTQQIALNFAGGSVPGHPTPEPSVSGGSHTARDYSPVHPGRASRGAGRAPVTVAFRTLSTSATGFRGEATVTNHGAGPIHGWTLALRYSQTRIVAVRGATIVREGATLVVHNLTGHALIAPGRSARVVFTAEGARALPVACAFNGRACRS